MKIIRLTSTAVPSTTVHERLQDIISEAERWERCIEHRAIRYRCMNREPNYFVLPRSREHGNGSNKDNADDTYEGKGNDQSHGSKEQKKRRKQRKHSDRRPGRTSVEYMPQNQSAV